MYTFILSLARYFPRIKKRDVNSEQFEAADDTEKI